MESNKPQVTTMSYTTYCLTGTAIYFVISAVILKIITAIGQTHGDWNTESTLVENIYYRGVYYTKYLSGAKFLFHYVMQLIGFTFVNIVNLQNVRKNPILDQHMSPASFYKTAAIVGPAIFLISQNGNIRGRNDVSSYCTADNMELEMPKSEFQPELMLPAADPMMQLFDSIGRMGYFEVTSIGCHIYNGTEVFQYNLLWLIAYYFGLQFTHADQGILKKFVLDWNVMKTWPPILWAVFCVLIAAILLLVSILVRVYVEYHILKDYFYLIAVIAAWFYYKSQGAKNIHVHHYTLMMGLQALCCYQDIFITVLSGVFNGIMIEGASRWGYDPIFVYDTDEIQNPN